MRPLAGQTIARLTFDHEVTFLGDAGDELHIETPFTLSTSTGSYVIDPHMLTDDAASLFTVLHLPVSEVLIAEDGTLAVTWESGTRIRVEPHDDFEAWTLTSRAGSRYVCTPGGSVTTWSDP